MRLVYLLIIYSFTSCSLAGPTFATKEQKKQTFATARFDQGIILNIPIYDDLSKFLLEYTDTIIAFRDSKNSAINVGPGGVDIDTVLQKSDCHDFFQGNDRYDNTNVPDYIKLKLDNESSILFINADFTVFTDLVQYLYKELKGVAGIETAIHEAARGWYEQALVETIIGLQSLVNRKDWTPNDIDKALSEEALTAAVMQRYHILKAVKKDVTSKVGSLKAITNRLLLMCA